MKWARDAGGIDSRIVTDIIILVLVHVFVQRWGLIPSPFQFPFEIHSCSGERELRLDLMLLDMNDKNAEWSVRNGNGVRKQRAICRCVPVWPAAVSAVFRRCQEEKGRRLPPDTVACVKWQASVDVVGGETKKRGARLHGSNAFLSERAVTPSRAGKHTLTMPSVFRSVLSPA